MKNLLITFLLLFTVFETHAQFYEWSEITESQENSNCHQYFEVLGVNERYGCYVINSYYFNCLPCPFEKRFTYVDRLGQSILLDNGWYDWDSVKCGFLSSNRVGIVENFMGTFFTAYEITNNIKTTEIIINLPDIFPVSFASGSEKDYYFLYTDSVVKYNSMGIREWNRPVAGGTNIYADNHNNYYIEDNSYVTKYNDSTSTVIYQKNKGTKFSIDPVTQRIFILNQNGVRIFNKNGNQLRNYPGAENFSNDEYGNFTYTIGNVISHFHDTIMQWQKIPPLLTPQATYSFLSPDGGFVRGDEFAPFPDNSGTYSPDTLIAPPSLSIFEYDDHYHCSNYYFYMQKFNMDTLQNAVQLSLEHIPAKICTGNPTQINYSFTELGPGSLNDTVYIELSDSTGSFSTSLIIAQSTEFFALLNIPDSIPEGQGYKIRGVCLSQQIISQVYGPFTVAHSPRPVITVDNSIYRDSIFITCVPTTLTLNQSNGGSVQWMQWNIDDEEFDYLNDNDSVYNLNYAMEYITAEVYGINNCIAKAPFVFVFDPVSPEIYIKFKDTVCMNEGPVPVKVYEDFFPGYFQSAAVADTVSFFTTVNFDSLGPGTYPLHYYYDHHGTPCVTYDTTVYVTVLSCNKNIITGSIKDGDNFLCTSDTAVIPFSVLDSSIYPPGTMFYAELVPHDPWYPTYLMDSSTTSPINAFFPHNAPANLYSGYFIRVYSNLPGDTGTLNADGVIQLQESAILSTSALQGNCQPAAQITVSSSLQTDIEWYRNDTLQATASGYTALFPALLDGSYYAKVNSEGCISQSSDIIINSTAHLPILNVDPGDPYFEICKNDSVTVSLIPDTLSTINWYKDSILLTGISDMLITSDEGIYDIIAVANDVCQATVKFSFQVNITPDVSYLQSIIPPALCPATIFQLNIFNDVSADFEWFRDGYSFDYDSQISISDTSEYYCIVIDNNLGCQDTSETIQFINFPEPVINPQGNVVVLPGFSRTLHAILPHPGFEIQWQLNNADIPGATAYGFSANTPGPYQYILTNPGGGCSDTSAITTITSSIVIPVSRPVSYPFRNGNISEIKIYPNPVKQLLHIEGEIPEDARYQITDMTGRIVKQGEASKIINVSNFAPGIYTFTLKTKEVRVQCGFVKIE